MNRRSRRIDFTQDFLANSQSFIINDIDLPLINYGFICRQDFSDYSNGRRNIRYQSYESFLLIVSYIFNVIRYRFYIIDSVDGRVPDNYLDIVQYRLRGSALNSYAFGLGFDSIIFETICFN